MADADAQDQEKTAVPVAEPQFSIQRIYLKDASLESPAAPQVFAEKWAPKIQLDVNTSRSKLSDELYEVVLKVTVTASQNDKPVMLIEIQQAGLFVCKGFQEDQIQAILSSNCPDILFPYAREAVDTLAVKASFPPFALAPMNFQALFKQAVQQQQEEAKAKAQAAAATETNH